MRTKVAIVDYGMGNLASVAKAIKAVRRSPELITTAAEVDAAQILVLPGVGAFPDAMANLARAGLIEPLRRAAREGRPLLGICLGMQLLFTRGTEKGDCEGLSILDGTVVRFPDTAELKVPHMGWNQLEPTGAHPLFAGVPPNSFVYFVHSFYPEASPGIVLATTEYGGRFPCVVGRGRTIGIQFHPEKSQSVGLKLLSNFFEMAKSRKAVPA